MTETVLLLYSGGHRYTRERNILEAFEAPQRLLIY